MGTFNTMAKNACRDMLIHSGQEVTYRGSAGVITTFAVIDLDTELFGAEVQAGDLRWTCILLAEDIVDPQREDEVIDEDDIVWKLQERLPNSDRWIEEWTVTKR